MTARSAARRLHRWLGLGVAIPLAITGLSGSALVYRESIDRWLAPELVVVRPGQTRAPLQPMLDAVARAHPAERVTRLRMPRRADASYEIWLGDNISGRYVYGDPYTGRILGERSARSFPAGWLFALHTELLAGEAGKQAVGVLGALLFLLGVSGIVLWWPRPGARVGPSLGIAFGTSAGRVNRDLHRAAGFYSSWLLVIGSITGTSLVFFGPFQRALNAVTRSAPAPVAPSARSPTTLPALPMDSLLSVAERAQPGGAISYIYFAAGGPRATVRVRKQLRGELHPNGKSFVHLDPRTGAVLLVQDGRVDPTGARIYSALYPIHTGAVFGAPTRVIAMLAGLMPLVLGVTGAGIWWRRR